MNEIEWKKLVGQPRIKQMFSAARAHNTLAHAYLFSGMPGTGKFQAALELCMSLFCTDTAHAPCYECTQCNRLLRYAHPDFSCVLPLQTDAQHRDSSGLLNDKGWDLVTRTCKARIENPYAPASRQRVPTIPLEIIKEAIHLIHRGPLDAPLSAVILDQVEFLNRESSNALLKTLEEPPENTLLILTTNRINALLPTVISRCQNVRFGMLAPQDIKTIVSTCAPECETVNRDTLYASGSATHALRMCDESYGYIEEKAQQLLHCCIRRDWDDAVPLIEELREHGDYETATQIFWYIAQMLRSQLLHNLAVSQKYIFTTVADEQRHVHCFCDPSCGERLARLCQDSIRAIHARGNTALVFTSFMSRFGEIMHHGTLGTG